MIRTAVTGGASGRLVVAVAAVVCASVLLPGSAGALTYGGGSPWLVCFNATEAAEVAARYTPLTPASNATVSVGAPVTFSGESTRALTFDAASTEALLSSPDVDSSVGSQVGSFYDFTSTKATASARTVYWRASFTFTPEDCESLVTFTTPVQTLNVTPSEAELQAAKKRQEEEAESKRRQEEAAQAAAGKVVLDGTVITVLKRHEAKFEIACSDIEHCAGELLLSVRVPVGRGRGTTRTKAETAGTERFSIAAGQKEMVDVSLDPSARALLSSDHGRLSASLTIRRTSPLPSTTQVQRVRLEQPRVGKR